MRAQKVERNIYYVRMEVPFEGNDTRLATTNRAKQKNAVFSNIFHVYLVPHAHLVSS
jgi:hypothetical protein